MATTIGKHLQQQEKWKKRRLMGFGCGAFMDEKCGSFIVERGRT
jgi:hypothetical protein